MEMLKKKYEKEVKILNVPITEIDTIPTVRFKDAKEMIAKEYNRKIKDPYDLEPENQLLKNFNIV